MEFFIYICINLSKIDRIIFIYSFNTLHHMENRHSQAVPQDIAEQVKNLLTEAIKLLKPYCPTLTVEQRQTLPKMSDGTLSFGAKSLEHAINHPEFLPSHISLDDWKIDMADVTNLKQVMVLIGDINQMVDDTRLTAGNEAYFAGRGYYHNVQRAAGDGVQGALPIQKDLATQFANRRPLSAGKKAE